MTSTEVAVEPSAGSASNKVTLPTLTAMVVGSMVGAGVFSLPARFGRATGVFGALIAWVVAGAGMLMLVWRERRRGHQPHRHRRQGRADPGVHRRRRAGLRLGQVLVQLVGRRGRLAVDAVRTGEGDDDHHHVRLPRHRGRHRVLPLRQEARGRRQGHRARVPQRAGDLRPRHAAVLRRAVPRGPGDRRAAVDGHGDGGRGRALGVGVHPHRRRRVRPRRVPRMDADVGGDDLHPGDRRRHAPLPAADEQGGDADRRLDHDQRDDPGLPARHADVGRRAELHARPLHQPVADPVPAGRRLRAEAGGAARDLRG